MFALLDRVAYWADRGHVGLHLLADYVIIFTIVPIGPRIIH